MPGDELAAELLTTALNADPLVGSLSGIPGYDALLPDFSQEAEAERRHALDAIATRAERTPQTGHEETELQTLDFVRCLARGMAGAAAVPVIEFTISDTFAAPVGGVLMSLPKLPLDSEERRGGLPHAGYAGSRTCSPRWRIVTKRARAKAGPRWRGSSKRRSPNST